MQPPVQTIVLSSQQRIAVDRQTKTAVPQVLERDAFFEPASLDLEHGLPLGLHDTLLDAVNGFLCQADAAGELVLAQTQHRTRSPHLGRKRGAFDAQLLAGPA